MFKLGKKAGRICNTVQDQVFDHKVIIFALLFFFFFIKKIINVLILYLFALDLSIRNSITCFLAEGSWIQGGGRSQTGGSSGSQSLAQGPLPHHSAGVDHAGGRNSLGPHPPPGVAMGPGGPGLGISANGPPMHAPPLHLPPGTSPPQFRTIPPPLVGTII